MSADIISPRSEYREQDYEKFLLIKTNTALEAGQSQVLGMPRPMGTPRCGRRTGSEADRARCVARYITLPQHRKMSNMPYYMNYMSRAVTGKNRKWLLADTFLFLPVTIGRKPAAR